MSNDKNFASKQLFPQLEHFGTTLYVPGMLLKQACINAVHKKYNRAFKGFADLETFFDILHRNIPDDLKLEYTEGTDYDPNTFMIVPISFMQWHYHRNMKPCEQHARVMINVPGMFKLTDIEQEAWDNLLKAESSGIVTVEKTC